jgi:regulator of protease activity HflC (stomatin/prohibitin superfamily)
MMSDRSVPGLRQSSEAPAHTMSGYGQLLVLLLLLVAFCAAFTQIGQIADALVVLWLTIATFAFLFVACGFYLLQPNQAAVVTLFGDYRGTDRAAGLRWTWPWMMKKKVSLRANNIISERIKVNDLRAGAVRRRRLQGVRECPDRGGGAHDRLALSL